MSLTELHLTPATTEAAHETRFRSFLDAHLDQELLRFTTAGSVDDGKSTLIGRLLHDTKSVYEDQLASIRASRVNRAGNGQVDLSLLTDGLRAEREQGITIDVAYRYFSTSRRKFIIADTPGHEQYTRNMATGASTADVAVVLIDANAFQKAGNLLPQSRRHTYIASLLRIPHVVAAVNKMDLVGYDEAIFGAIQNQFLELANRLGLQSVSLIPVSALAGDNVVDASDKMPWYTGPTLLQYLETVPLQALEGDKGPLRFPVQLVVRPDANFRGFAGRVERGVLSTGQLVRALPSGRTTRVRSLVTYDGELKQAHAPQSVTVELEDEIDLSRGEMLIADQQSAPSTGTRLRAMAVWMHEQPLTPGSTYLLKHTTRSVRATVRAIRYRVDVNSTEHLPATELAMNDIAELELETSLPLFFDPYSENRSTGSFILIDALSNATVGAGMLVAAVDQDDVVPKHHVAPLFMYWPKASAEQIARVQGKLSSQGRPLVLVDDPQIPVSALPAAVRALELAGATALSANADLPAQVLDALRTNTGARILEGSDRILEWLEA